MAKTRMLKHDLRTSEKVATWPVEIRYFWVLLWGYVDDHGKGKDNPLLVKADTFPLDPDVTGPTVDGWLWHLAAADVIARYTVDGTDYLQILNWREHQKPPHPTPDVLPASTDARATRRELHAPCMKDAGNTHESLTPVLGWVESGFGSGFVNESSPAVIASVRKSAADEAFEDAWTCWPKKVNKAKSLEKFKAAAKTVGVEELAALVVAFGDAYATTTTKQFTPGLNVWLNDKRWTDELPSLPETERPKQTAAQRNLSTVAYFEQLEQQKGIEA